MIVIAGMLDCEIHYPKEIFEILNSRQLDLLVDLVRDALVNAIRHGNANCLFIQKRFTRDGIGIHIYDNGVFHGEQLKPGGMRNLIQMFKEKGAELRVYLGEKGVELDAVFFNEMK